MINPNEYGSLLYDNNEKEYLNNVIDSKRIFRYSKTKYPYASWCEEKIKKIVSSKFALTVTSGTAALKTALVGANINSNDRVLVSSYTFLATALSVVAVGGIPIPIEIDLDNGVDIVSLEREIKKGCKALIVVHFQGRTFDLMKVKKICEKNNIILIEDACQAFGSRYKNNYAGTFGDIGVYSFQQFKQLSCGEGGCVVTNDEKKYNRMRNYTDMGAIREGFPSWNSNDALFGENYRMNNLCAAVLYAQLEKFDDIIKKQRKSRENIMKNLRQINNILVSKDSSGDTGMNIIILLNSKTDKDKVINIGKEKDILFRNMWSGLYYNNDLFKKNKLTSIDLIANECESTENLIEKMLVIPIPPTLDVIGEKSIIDTINIIKEKGYLS